MTRPGLEVTWLTLRAEVGQFLGFNADPDNWSSNQTAAVQRIIGSGLRQYLFPPPLRDGEAGYTWSFMAPRTYSVTTVADTAAYDLPADFGGFDGQLHITDDKLARIIVADETILADEAQYDTLAGKPTHVAVRPKDHDKDDGQIYEAVFWPTPDDAYTITGKHTVFFDLPDADNIFLPGGALHGEGYIEACLSVAEQRLDDQVGLHSQAFMRMLQANIHHDAKMTSPSILGYNHDWTEPAEEDRRKETVNINY